jgi:hypothetical protein
MFRLSYHLADLLLNWGSLPFYFGGEIALRLKTVWKLFDGDYHQKAYNNHSIQMIAI